MEVVEIIKIVAFCVIFVAGVISSIIGFVKAAKAKKAAKTAQESEAAQQKMIDEANKLIAYAETFYKSLDTILKQTEGTGAGAYKKESVMVKLQAFANTLGITFDAEYWSKKVDEIVKLTKEVNAKD